MSRYTQQFPDYDGLLPTWLEGWQDTSWHNDMCPSLGREIKDEFGTVQLSLYVEYRDPAKRATVALTDVPFPRFTLYVHPAGEDPETGITLQAETLEELRAVALKWYLDHVGDSILEEDLTTSQILVDVGTMWGFQNMESPEVLAVRRRQETLTRHTSETGGGCKAYIFEHASNFIWVTGDDGITLPTDEEGERKLLCLRDPEGNESGCIEVVAPMSNLLEFLAGIGADVF